MLITETRFVNGSGNVNNEKTVPGHNVKTFGKSLILFHWFDANHMSAKKFRPEDWRQVTYPSTRVGSCSFRLKRVIFSVQSKALDLKKPVYWLDLTFLSSKTPTSKTGPSAKPFLWAISSLIFKKSLSNLVILLILLFFFPAVFIRFLRTGHSHNYLTSRGLFWK